MAGYCVSGDQDYTRDSGRNELIADSDGFYGRVPQQETPVLLAGTTIPLANTCLVLQHLIDAQQKIIKDLTAALAAKG
jgi:hypothetical protein